MEEIKRKYEKPAMQVYELLGMQRLLTMSNRDPYSPSDTNPFGG